MIPLNALLLITADIVLLIFIVLNLIESVRERESRAATISSLGTVFHLFVLYVVIYVPAVRLMVTFYFGLLAVFFLILLVPGSPNRKALAGTTGYIVGNPEKVDERDIVFARQRLIPDSEAYKNYYEMHPEKKERDDRIRDRGVLKEPGVIDGGYRPNTSMMQASFMMPLFLGVHATPGKSETSEAITPEKATKVVKNYTRHLGADLVGVCEVNPLWVYSRRGEIHYDNWEDWGEKIGEVPRFALVFATEMNYEHVNAAPHTPTLAESGNCYAKGAYISTVLSQWFARMGYKGIAEHSRHYDVITPPLGVDAGLGEVGRQGYLIVPRYGARVRVFAILTDMPLIPDNPISIGVEEYCEHCMKCADTCPSKSIPQKEKTVHNGIEMWKMNAETCHDYWAQVGTDCAICMAICPFSRPDTPLHNTIRWFIAHSPVARRIFPIIDDILYGKHWKPKQVSKWLDYSHTR